MILIGREEQRMWELAGRLRKEEGSTTRSRHQDSTRRRRRKLVGKGGAA